MTLAQLDARRLRAVRAVLSIATLIVLSACGGPTGRNVTSDLPSNAGPHVGASASPSTPASAAAGTDPAMAAAPYLYLGGEDLPDPQVIMKATGVRWFTLAFVLNHGACDPQWDGTRPLLGGADQSVIASIRQRGGDVIVSSGGQNGPWLEQSCSTSGSLAAAYQHVIDAYHLKAIDIDVEGSVYQSPTLQQRIIDALKIVKAADPGIVVDVTFPVDASGPNPAMINRAAASGLVVDCWAAMPFDMDAAGQNMGDLTRRSIDQLVGVVEAAYRYPEDQAFRHIGISSMNGITDTQETITTNDFQTMLAYAQRHHLARFTFWAANRDRPCGNGTVPGDTCSGLPQANWDFTRIVAQYRE
jgi:hypothetical protein